MRHGWSYLSVKNGPNLGPSRPDAVVVSGCLSKLIGSAARTGHAHEVHIVAARSRGRRDLLVGLRRLAFGVVGCEVPFNRLLMWSSAGMRPIFPGPDRFTDGLGQRQEIAPQSLHGLWAGDLLCAGAKAVEVRFTIDAFGVCGPRAFSYGPGADDHSTIMLAPGRPTPRGQWVLDEVVTGAGFEAVW